MINEVCVCVTMHDSLFFVFSLTHTDAKNISFQICKKEILFTVHTPPEYIHSNLNFKIQPYHNGVEIHFSEWMDIVRAREENEWHNTCTNELEEATELEGENTYLYNVMVNLTGCVCTKIMVTYNFNQYAHLTVCRNGKMLY